MENTERENAQNAIPNNDLRNAETNALPEEAITNAINEGFSGEASRYQNDEPEERIHAMASYDDPDDDEDDDDDDDAGDWGHVDPAESNSPFPDSNDPSGPGSAV